MIQFKNIIFTNKLDKCYFLKNLKLIHNKYIYLRKKYYLNIKKILQKFYLKLNN